MAAPAVRRLAWAQLFEEVRDGLRVWQLLRRLLLKHDDEADDAEAQVASLVREGVGTLVTR